MLGPAVPSSSEAATPALQGMSLGWTNPVLLGALALVALPGIRRRVPLAAPVAVAGLGFTLAIVALQELQLADGGPYPGSFRYFSIIDPLPRWWPQRAIANASATSAGSGMSGKPSCSLTAS